MKSIPLSEMIEIDTLGFEINHNAFELIKILYGYEDAIKNAANRYEPSIVARYVISLSSVFNKFYHECSILHEEDERVKKARLCLVETVQSTISEACGLLGITCPEEM